MGSRCHHSRQIPHRHDLHPCGDPVAGLDPNVRFGTAAETVATLLKTSSGESVNVRSYEPESPRSREFVYGLRNVEDAIATIDRLAAEGLHLIVNETIDVSDGGVSGVAYGDVLEFAPDDTPRCVEKPGVIVNPIHQMLGLNS